MKALFDNYYANYTDMVSRGSDFPTTAEARQSIIKLSILLEESCLKFMSNHRMELFYRTNQRMLSRLNHPLASIYIRLHASFLKYLRTRMALEELLPFDNEELAQGIEQFWFKLKNLLSQEDLEVEGVYNALCSFMDLCVCFQPSMKDMHSHPVFNLCSFDLRADTVEQLAGLVERQVFQGSDASNGGAGFHQAMVLQYWSSLCRNYKTLPKTQASKSIISRYSLKSPFKSELEGLLKALWVHDNMFEKTVAMAILDMSNHGDLTTLRTFKRAIEISLRENVRGTSSVVVKIRSNILRKLKGNVDSIEKAEGNNRLRVLGFVSMITKFVDDERKQELETRIPTYLVNSDLTASERNMVDAFRDFLQENDQME